MDDAELIYAFGFNAFSQIYSKKACIVNEPVQIEQKDVSTIIGASWATSFARTPDEAIYCWGWLEPGVESKPTQLYVSQFGEATTWTSTRTGDRLIAYSLTAKKLFSMASIRKNADGRCSAATVEETCLSTGVASISCTETDAWICSDDGGIFSVSLSSFIISQPFSVGHFITQVACGNDHTLLLSSHGLSFAFGIGSRGQLGLGDSATHTQPQLIEHLGGLDVTSLCAGGWHSLAVTKLGSAYAWGWNVNGQLGVEEKTAMSCHAPQLVEFIEDVEVTGVSSGSRHTAAVTSTL
ncbi:probable E3 ubiquitin-protein ligase HERC3 isoform X2 [Oscarella lobularis]|uniref:probable E3 ubiquitin-protein ligase HERC3 isoform X2 n=1 Tax=Oscarella lobularis TaxID=121494 RepID=UPI0033137182